MSVKYGDKLRKFLLKYFIKLCNCDAIKVFEAGNTPEIVLITKKLGNNNLRIQAFNEDNIIVERGSTPRKILEWGNWGMILSDNLNILITIIKNNQK